MPQGREASRREGRLGGGGTAGEGGCAHLLLLPLGLGLVLRLLASLLLLAVAGLVVALVVVVELVRLEAGCTRTAR